MDTYLSGFVKFTENPFLLALLMSVILGLIIYYFFSAGNKPTKKLYFRTLFYMYLASLTLLWLHNSAMRKLYENKLDNKMKISTFEKTGSDELQIPAKIEGETVDIYAKPNEF